MVPVSCRLTTRAASRDTRGNADDRSTARTTAGSPDLQVEAGTNSTLLPIPPQIPGTIVTNDGDGHSPEPDLIAIGWDRAIQLRPSRAERD